MNNTKINLVIKPEIKRALELGLAVVALESNVITHGLDYPENKHTALQVEAAVRESGAIPATIGVANGKLLIGMDESEIELFATTANIPKVSTRDLPVVLATKQLGATTVASSIIAAELAGICFFASAGIGGVHRGANNTMDISSDLMQFTRSRVAVVCAGAKNILDLGLTLEYLETHNVPIISYQFDDFPAFYCRSSGYKAPQRIDDASILADIIETQWLLDNKRSVLITTPTKLEDAIDSDDVNDAINAAISSAQAQGISGNKVTKYIMKAIDEVTKGRSAKANSAVLINTARVAGHLAVAHAKQSSNKREVA
ncbi:MULTISPECIES: pseudouridine-5'-phosphate glycosidase [Pseudoalteromonas]|uniref:Pseudouridine-5'-phosphate glycosidase n=1 Tax=Pseudoalteromonas fuliginea TaxID=1872678 RepID=A0A063KUC5_9GAMM|nr:MULTISPECIES: pseudouridine-5'-phosphate glycosidase [Pseudoalteromonas]ALQ06834.1 pseudouridine-5-phosphate glycosidase [Pseudoalteromonas sp. Bsw20308]ATG78919.1 pseudouridine-5-phosphate glycosidase [Pseudoalteromonas sp. 1_2015MBL_MicDiv]KAA1158239.1 pseudouridine-5'-phosphate glycosidase [Pseudoalteromonas fuliginea]KAA1163428.1 pseudouridine-5'-phosphate glycosidase [Pseudoalteromonas fuliginea]KAA1167833.1 pseudouridine-5'-phosphate glycosidase [Pseudoalteromonas fuliginea]